MARAGPVGDEAHRLSIRRQVHPDAIEFEKLGTKEVKTDNQDASRAPQNYGRLLGQQLAHFCVQNNWI